MIIAKDEGKDFEKIPAGTVQAVCYAVWDLGKQKGEWQGNEKIQHKIIIAWETTHKMQGEGEYKGKRMVINKQYTLSLFENANLCTDLESWRTKTFTEEEKKGFDIEKLINVNCLLSIIHKDSKGKTYANVKSVSPLMAGQEKLVPENKPDKIPEWVQKLQEKAIDAVPFEPKSTKDFLTEKDIDPTTSEGSANIQFELDKDPKTPIE